MKEILKTVYDGFVKSPAAMLAAVCVIATASMFYYIKTTISAQLEREERRSDKQVETVLRILRPDLEVIKSNTQQAKDNTDSLTQKIK